MADGWMDDPAARLKIGLKSAEGDAMMLIMPMTTLMPMMMTLMMAMTMLMPMMMMLMMNDNADAQYLISHFSAKHSKPCISYNIMSMVIMTMQMEFCMKLRAINGMGAFMSH